MKIIYRGKDRDVVENSLIVVQTEPQCRTILGHKIKRTKKYKYQYVEGDFFVSLPYMIFVIAHENLFFRDMRAFFINNPLKSFRCHLGIPCFPNIDDDGIVCLDDFSCEAQTEQELVTLVLDYFWLSRFNKSEIDVDLSYAHLAKLTKKDRHASEKINWLEVTRQNFLDISRLSNFGEKWEKCD